MQIDVAKVRRESLRWVILLALNNARPVKTHESSVLAIVKSIYPDATQHELRIQFDYLSDRKLVTVDKKPDNIWWCDVTRLGTDLVEYNIDCEPGIARPEKYW